MPKSPQHHLLLAVHAMPMSAIEALTALASAHDWSLRQDARVPPRWRSGELLVATAPVWAALADLAGARRPRGVGLVTAEDAASAATSTAPASLPEAVLSWPCDVSLLREQLSRLMAPVPLALDPDTRIVMHRGHRVHLTPRECRLLQVLMAHAGEAVHRDVLEAALHVWGQEFESNTLDVHVHRLRRKLPDAGIRAVRGYGYVLLATP